MLIHHRLVLWSGLGGTALLVLGGTFYVVSSVWASSFTQTLEVLVAAPFVGLWMLSPLLWATRPGSESSGGEGAPRAQQVAGLVMVGVGAAAYLWAFVIQPVVFQRWPGVESLLLVTVVPAVQWVVLGGGAAVQGVLARSGSRS